MGQSCILFAEAALRAIADERSVVDTTTRNWPDFRSSAAPNPSWAVVVTAPRGFCSSANGLPLAAEVAQTESALIS